MEKPPLRRSAGMLASPLARGTGPAAPPAPARPAPPVRAARPGKPSPTPKVLMDDVAAPRGTEVSEYRQAFRAFMTARRLRPTAWAKMAGVPVGEILAYLTGRQRFFSPGVAEKLAEAAGVPPQTLFRPEAGAR